MKAMANRMLVFAYRAVQSLRGIPFVILVVGLVYCMLAFAPAATDAETCPKLSQASLDLETTGCATTFDALKVEKRTSWELEKTTSTSSPLAADDGAPYTYDITVTEGPTSRVLVSTGQIVATNSGQLSAFLESVVVNLQKKSDKGTKYTTVASALAVRAAACKDGINATGNPEGALTCFGTFQNSAGASLLLTDPFGNDPTAFVPSPPSQPIPPSDCTNATKFNFKAEFNLASLGITAGSSVRIEILVTFGSAGGRGGSPDSVSCTVDSDCSGTINSDDPNTCNVNESESNNVRTIATRSSQQVPPDTPVCQDVTVSDPGTASGDEACVTVSDDTNTADGAMTAASGTAGTETGFTVDGTATCADTGACSTVITDTATLTCDDGRNEFISGSPASASINVTCTEDQPLSECGNGILEDGEQCDDGNLSNGDGCSSVCTTEQVQVGDFCTRTQGCWGQQAGPTPCPTPGSGGGPCRALLTATTGGFADTFPSGLFIGEGVTCLTGTCGKSGTQDGPSDGTFADQWTSANAITCYLPAGETSGTLSVQDLDNPTSTSSGVFGGQLVAAELNVAFNDAGASLVTGTNTTTKLGDLVYQSCNNYIIAPDIQGKTVRQVINAANRVISGEFGVFTSPSAPSQSVTIPGFGTVTIDALKTALDALNNNFDNCTANLGCLALPTQ